MLLLIRLQAIIQWKDGPEYAEAEWLSGWIALSFLDDPILATQHFHNFYEQCWLSYKSI